MNALLQKLRDEIRSIWRFRWIAVLVAWGVCILGWTAVLLMPDTYEASARVFVDTRTTLSTVTRGLAVESDLESQILRVRQALLGGPQLETVAREAGLYPPAATPQERQALIRKLRDRVQITGGMGPGSAGLYVISFKDRDRERSLAVVDRLLNTFVESTLGGKREGSEQAQRFLVEQIAEYERRLSAAEERLADFKKQHVGLMPGAQGDYFSRLQAQMEAVEKAKASLAVALRRREELSRQLRGEKPFVENEPASGAALAAGSGNDTASRIRETQARLDELLLKYTEKHPDVIALRDTLEELKARHEAEIEALRRGDAGVVARSGLSANPVFQSIQLQLNEADVEIAALRAEIADGQRKVAELRQLVDTAPEVEAEFARLNRDYDVTRAQYQALVERLERARLAEEAEATGIVRFEVIDPPAAPFTPVAPNRPRLILMVLFAGLVAGGGIAYGLHFLRPVFSSVRQLHEITGLPVLGAISVTWLDRYRALQRRSVVAFAGAAAALMVVAVLLLLVHGRMTQIVRSLVA